MQNAELKNLNFRGFDRVLTGVLFSPTCTSSSFFQLRSQPQHWTEVRSQCTTPQVDGITMKRGDRRLEMVCRGLSCLQYNLNQQNLFTKIMYTLTKWSLSDYHKMIEAGILSDRRVELISGNIIEMSPEGPLHCSINHRAVTYLRSLLKQNAVVREAHPITLNDSEPEPDIAIVRFPDRLYLNRHPYSEDIYWLIEIADTTLNQDLGIKKKAYAQAGIAEYWVIDLSSVTLTVFLNPTEEDYQTKYEYHDGIVSPQAFPEIEIMVKRLLSAITDGDW